MLFVSGEETAGAVYSPLRPEVSRKFAVIFWFLPVFSQILGRVPPVRSPMRWIYQKPVPQSLVVLMQTVRKIR